MASKLYLLCHLYCLSALWPLDGNMPPLIRKTFVTCNHQSTMPTLDFFCFWIIIKCLKGKVRKSTENSCYNEAYKTVANIYFSKLSLSREAARWAWWGQYHIVKQKLKLLQATLCLVFFWDILKIPKQVGQYKRLFYLLIYLKDIYDCLKQWF